MVIDLPGAVVIHVSSAHDLSWKYKDQDWELSAEIKRLYRMKKKINDRSQSEITLRSDDSLKKTGARAKRLGSSSQCSSSANAKKAKVALNVQNQRGKGIVLAKSGFGLGRRKHVHIGSSFQADVPVWTGPAVRNLTRMESIQVRDPKWLASPLWSPINSNGETNNELVAHGHELCSYTSPISDIGCPFHGDLPIGTCMMDAPKRNSSHTEDKLIEPKLLGFRSWHDGYHNGGMKIRLVVRSPDLCFYISLIPAIGFSFQADAPILIAPSGKNLSLEAKRSSDLTFSGTQVYNDGETKNKLAMREPDCRTSPQFSIGCSFQDDLQIWEVPLDKNLTHTEAKQVSDVKGLGNSLFPRGDEKMESENDLVARSPSLFSYTYPKLTSDDIRMQTVELSSELGESFDLTVLNNMGKRVPHDWDLNKEPAFDSLVIENPVPDNKICYPRALQSSRYKTHQVTDVYSDDDDRGRQPFQDLLTTSAETRDSQVEEAQKPILRNFFI